MIAVRFRLRTLILIVTILVVASGCSSVDTVSQHAGGGTLALKGRTSNARGLANFMMSKRCPTGYEVTDEKVATPVDGSGSKQLNVTYRCVISQPTQSAQPTQSPPPPQSAQPAQSAPRSQTVGANPPPASIHGEASSGAAAPELSTQVLPLNFAISRRVVVSMPGCVASSRADGTQAVRCATEVLSAYVLPQTTPDSALQSAENAVLDAIQRDGRGYGPPAPWLLPSGMKIREIESSGATGTDLTTLGVVPDASDSVVITCTSDERVLRRDACRVALDGIGRQVLR